MNYLIMHIVGARPNFMKIAPIVKAIEEYNQTHPSHLDQIIVHTGQHYDENMSELFFDHLGLPKPDINLEVGSASHAVQTAEIMIRFEKVLLQYQPDAIIVVGDVNSTIACTLVASKIEYPTQPNEPYKPNEPNKRNKPLIVHVEAGLRSFDRTMPEEINRILTDQLSDLLFTTEEDANENLKREGIPSEKIFFVGNVMIDTLFQHLEKAKKSKILQKLGLINSINAKNAITSYAVLTLHRPSNVDNKETFSNILEALKEISKRIPIIFPAHPRTQNRIKQFGFENYFNFLEPINSINSENPINSINATNPMNAINLINPLGYLDFLWLMANAKLVLTDSGGIQEETTVLGIPCVTIRKNTERPITVKMGTNIVAGTQKENIINAALSQLNRHNNISNPIPPLWDGKAAKRIVKILVKKLSTSS